MEKETFLRKVRKTGTSFGINIPLEVIDFLKLSEGDLIRVEIQPARKKE